MKKIDAFTNQYSLSKTLRFSLIPVGKTEENFNAKLLLEQDKKRAEDYEKVKKYIDRYHKVYIESVLSKIILDNINVYAELYYKNNKEEKDLKNMEKLEADFRKVIAKKLTESELYKQLFGKEMIQNLLPAFLQKEDEIASVEMFRNFTTYFTGFYTNRKNIYSKEAKSTAISYRCINENLPKFLDNARNFIKIKELLSKDSLVALNEDSYNLHGATADDVFSVDYFSFVLAQSGIDRYNEIIGGYTCSDGTKVKGINEYINLHNQQVARNDKTKRLPLMKPLYKQILSDKETVSFIPENFKNDNEVIFSVREYYTSFENIIDKIEDLFSDFSTYNLNGIFVSSGLPVTAISNSVFGFWGAIAAGWNSAYELSVPVKKNQSTEKYIEKRLSEYKKIKSFSIAELQRYGETNRQEGYIGSIAEYFTTETKNIIDNIRKTFNDAKDLLSKDYEESNNKKLCNNERAIELLKNLLDSIKSLERLLKFLHGTGKEDDRDDVFYGLFLPLYDDLSSIDRLYDKVRNYVTQKPYSKDKIKLNFDNPTFLNGWAVGQEISNSIQLFRKENKYYIAVLDKEMKKYLPSKYKTPDSGNDIIEKMEYRQIASPSKDIPGLMIVDGVTKKINGRKEKVGPFAGQNIILEQAKERYLPKEINDIRKNKSYLTGDSFSKENLIKYIEYYTSRIKEYYDPIKFHLKNADEYKTYKEFLDDVDSQGYSVMFTDVSFNEIYEYVSCGYIYLFQIYNKDFSEYSHGTPNLHTMYFKMLFDEKNIDNVVFKLNGEAEMFYREASIKDNEKVVHPANQPVDNKNTRNAKKQSLFEYDLIKDKRFTKRQFSIHIPITMNFKAIGTGNINEVVRKSIKDSESNYVIGIDRGERNLLYVCVINDKGEIVKQKSLNEIIGDTGYTVDYHNLLDEKEKARAKARESWGTVENIKELKDGYLSQVVHEICTLAVEYDAIIVMEDLNFGFKKGRFKVEKQVYQKFENMLLSKLNFLIDKKLSPEQKGGLLNAYQLTNKVEGVNKAKQSGFVFYVPAWDTSKIDPVTGFVDLLKPKYTSVADAKQLIEKFDDIRYNKLEDLLEFDIDYSKILRGATSYRTKWTICTNGERIKSYRNPEKNNEWCNDTVILTEEFKKLFEKYDIECSGSIKEKCLAIVSADFYREFIRLLSLTLQMRNSETGNVDVDYLISPVKDKNGNFYDSRNYTDTGVLPANADSNGAYNIARKGLWAIKVLKNTPDDELRNAKLAISNAEWLEFTQK